MNALRGVMSRPGFDLSTPESQRDVYNVAPTLAENLIKGHMGNLKTGAEVRNLGFTGQETQAKLAIEKQKHLGEMYRDISSRPSDANITAHAEDVEASPMYTPEEKTAVRAKAERLLAMPMADRMAMLSQQGATAGELRPQVVAPGASLMREGTVVGTAPDKAPTPTDLARLQNERAALLPGDPRIAQYDDAIRKATNFAPPPITNVKLPPQENAFESGLGAGQSKKIMESQTAAQGAAQILQTNDVGRSLLKSGAITGAGADFFVGLNKALKQANIDFGYADAATNSQAYGAAMAANTGQLIKQFGAGTAISDADRAYATKAAAGEITMDEAAIRKVLDINDRAARNVINRHNKSVKGIKTNVPLEVEIPRTVTRTGTSNGKKVIEYSDGSVEYAPN